MGTAYRRGASWWDVKRNFPQIIDQYIPSTDTDYQYVGYAAKGDGEVKKMNLTKNWSYAQNTFNALFKGGAKAEYDVGIIAHSQKHAAWPKYSKLSGAAKYHDSYALIVKHAQDNLDILKNATITEEYAKVNVTKEYKANLDKRYKKLKGLYTGKGETLFKKYTFFCMTYHQRRRQLSFIYFSG